MAMKNLKSFQTKYMGTFAALALFVATVGANRLCSYYVGQPVAPAELKKLRRF